MSLQITDISSKFSAYETCLEKMSTKNISKFYIEMKENEELLKNNIDAFKAEASHK